MKFEIVVGQTEKCTAQYLLVLKDEKTQDYLVVPSKIVGNVGCSLLLSRHFVVTVAFLWLILSSVVVPLQCIYIYTIGISTVNRNKLFLGASYLPLFQTAVTVESVTISWLYPSLIAWSCSTGWYIRVIHPMIWIWAHFIALYTSRFRLNLVFKI